MNGYSSTFREAHTLVAGDILYLDKKLYRIYRVDSESFANHAVQVFLTLVHSEAQAQTVCRSYKEDDSLVVYTKK